MITAICGLPGSGKSSLMCKLMKDIYFTQGRRLYLTTVGKINSINAKRKFPLTLPDRVPIYSDYEVKFKVGYEKYYSTYFLNGFYFGLKNSEVPIIPVVPYAKVFLSEVQRYYDSRKSKSLPDFVSRLFEMHRHNHYDIYLDLQRIGLLDLNIRDLSAQIIEVCEMNHEYNSQGGIVKTVWRCHVFDCWEDFDNYLNHSSSTKSKNVYFEHVGNIFNCYDSYSYESEFIPSEREDYLYLEHKNQVGTVAYIQSKLKQYYDFSIPKGYRKRD